MKGFFLTVLILGGLGAAGYFLYEPYIKPMLEGGAAKLTDSSLIGEKAEDQEAKPEAGSSSTSSASKPAAQPAADKPAAPNVSELDALLAERYPLPDILPLMEIVGNWANVPARAFPPEVYSSEPIAFELVINGQAVGSSTVAPGTPLKPVALVGDQLQIANIANASQSKHVNVDKTDFKQRITKRYDDFVEQKSAEVENTRAKVKEILESDPTKLAMFKGEKPPEVAASANDPRFAPVKQSILNGDVPSVKPEELKSFAWNGTETVRGAYPGTYDTVTVNFVVETIFGTFPVEYKVLLNGNTVVGWIDPITEDRI